MNRTVKLRVREEKWELAAKMKPWQAGNRLLLLFPISDATRYRARILTRSHYVFPREVSPSFHKCASVG